MTITTESVEAVKEGQYMSTNNVQAVESNQGKNEVA